MQTNADITLWNKYVDPDTRAEVYQRAEISRVAWEAMKAANTLRSGGQIEADKVTVYIPWSRGANHVKPRQFTLLADKAGFWTLQQGDIIARGIISQELSGAFTVSQLKAAYDDVFIITSVDDMSIGTQAMWHWQVGAK